ncbi:MAG: hypothetical protein ACLFU8_15590 [Anaerolineales bacterium]
MHTRGEYHSFLLRLWRASRESPWLFSLTRVGGEEQHTFSRMEDVVEFLEEQVDPKCPPEEVRSAAEENDL